MSEVSNLMESIQKNARNTYFIGIDKETGGLNDADNADDSNIPVGSSGSRHYAILQIAVIVYNGLFERLSKEPLDIIIYHSEEDLDKRVGEWSKEQFKETLMLKCPQSKISLAEAEQMVIKHLQELGIKEGDQVFMLGNSIRLDFEFMSAQMKELKKMFLYRLLDVSTFKTLFTTIYGREIANFNKEGTHDALIDIEESVAELEFYLSKFIRPLEEVLECEQLKKEGILNSKIQKQKKMLELLNPKESKNGSVFKNAFKLINWIEKNKHITNLTELKIYKDILECERSMALVVMQFLSANVDGIFGMHYHCVQDGKEVMISSKEFEKAITNQGHTPVRMEDGINIEDYNYSNLGYNVYTL